MRDKEFWKTEIKNMTIIEYQNLMRAITENNQEMLDSVMVDNL